MVCTLLSLTKNIPYNIPKTSITAEMPKSAAFPNAALIGPETPGMVVNKW